MIVRRTIKIVTPYGPSHTLNKRPVYLAWRVTPRYIDKVRPDRLLFLVLIWKTPPVNRCAYWKMNIGNTLQCLDTKSSWHKLRPPSFALTSLTMPTTCTQASHHTSKVYSFISCQWRVQYFLMQYKFSVFFYYFSSLFLFTRCLKYGPWFALTRGNNITETLFHHRKLSLSMYALPFFAYTAAFFLNQSPIHVYRVTPV